MALITFEQIFNCFAIGRSLLEVPKVQKDKHIKPNSHFY